MSVYTHPSQQVTSSKQLVGPGACAYCFAKHRCMVGVADPHRPATVTAMRVLYAVLVSYELLLCVCVCVLCTAGAASVCTESHTSCLGGVGRASQPEQPPCCAVLSWAEWPNRVRPPDTHISDSRLCWCMHRESTVLVQHLQRSVDPGRWGGVPTCSLLRRSDISMLFVWCVRRCQVIAHDSTLAGLVRTSQ